MNNNDQPEKDLAYYKSENQKLKVINKKYAELYVFI